MRPPGDDELAIAMKMLVVGLVALCSAALGFAWSRGYWPW